jgi:serine/threonine protein kinase
LHRDIKPDNFLIGSKYNKDTLYVIDYGLVKAYRYKITGEHIVFRSDKGVTGTVRYSSINTHMGYEASRRDDIECIMYVSIYLFYGKLPWQNPDK